MCGVQTQGGGGRVGKKRVFIIYTRVYIHYDDVRLFSLHSWWVYYITGPSITSAINAVFIINMLIVFCGTPKNSENGVEPKFLLWIQGTNKRWTAGRTAGVWPEECVSGGRYVFGRKSFVSGGTGVLNPLEHIFIEAQHNICWDRDSIHHDQLDSMIVRLRKKEAKHDVWDTRIDND